MELDVSEFNRDVSLKAIMAPWWFWFSALLVFDQAKKGATLPVDLHPGVPGAARIKLKQLPPDHTATSGNRTTPLDRLVLLLGRQKVSRLWFPDGGTSYRTLSKQGRPSLSPRNSLRLISSGSTSNKPIYLNYRALLYLISSQFVL